MHSFGLVHWLSALIPLLVALVIFGIPAAIILRRTGYHPAWALLGAIPGVALVGLWIFAFAKWPVLAGSDGEPSPKKPWDPA
jgi:hypothetical protein